MKIFYVNGKINVAALIVFILIPLLAGIISGYISMGEGSVDYIKPSLAPPDYVFPIVWTILYILMGIASYRVWMNRNKACYDPMALVIYFIQLIFNFFWSIIFFKYGMFEFAFVWLLILLVLVIITTIKFYQIDIKAGNLMIPYIIWLALAASLSYNILQIQDVQEVFKAKL